ncbi:MAG: chorismate pyruvate-lyase family protein [Cyanobacteria bacterium P01_C01_bin.38]
MSINYTEVPTCSETDQKIISNFQASTHLVTPDLGTFQKILLKANGTVTAMLEAYLSEPIQVVKLSEQLANMKLEFPMIKLNKQEQVITRKVLLQGEISQRNFIYADSLILINNLDELLSYELLNTNKPIGKLWSEHKIETFKEIIDSGEEPANELSNYFSLEPKENILFRTYCVFSKAKVIMIITEKFPQNYFLPRVSLA